MADVPPDPQPPFPLKDFVAMLVAGAEVSVRLPDVSVLFLDEAAASVLREAYVAAREELAGEPPEFDLTAAGWATEQFYRACQFLLCREVPADKVAATLGAPCPAARGPRTDFSVDLVFRHLPDLHDRARRLASGDPLVAALATWARDWPLSSPGVALETPPPLDTFSGSPALWRLYVDRVAAGGAEDRWRDPRVAAQLRADLGAFPDLAPALAESLRRANPPMALAATPPPFPA